MAADEDEEEDDYGPSSTPNFEQPNFEMRIKLFLEGGHVVQAYVPRMSPEEFAVYMFGADSPSNITDIHYMRGIRVSSIVMFEILNDDLNKGSYCQYRGTADAVSDGL